MAKMKTRWGLGVWAATAVICLTATTIATAAPLDSRDAAIAALRSEEPESRVEALTWLATQGDTADLDNLAIALRDEHVGVRERAESALVELWSRSGDRTIDDLLLDGIRQMNDGHIGQAVDTFSRIVALKPDFAEGWNKRATAYYLMGSYELSLQDCDEVMRRNPYHFGALSGYGMIYMRLGKLEEALTYFERALEVNPNLDGVQSSVDLLRQRLGRRQST